MDSVEKEIGHLKERTATILEKVSGIEEEDQLHGIRHKEFWHRLNHINDEFLLFKASAQERVGTLEAEVKTLRAKLLNNHRVANSRLWDSWKGLVGWILGIVATLFFMWVSGKLVVGQFEIRFSGPPLA